MITQLSLITQNWYAFVWHTALSVGTSVHDAPMVLDRQSTIYSTNPNAPLNGQYDILYALVCAENREAAWDVIRGYYPDAERNDWGPRFQYGLQWQTLRNFRIVRREARDTARQLRYARQLVYGKRQVSGNYSAKTKRGVVR